LCVFGVKDGVIVAEVIPDSKTLVPDARNLADECHCRLAAFETLQNRPAQFYGLCT
jgi:hypothetical protein